MAFIDQMGYVVPMKEVALDEKFVIYGELIAIIHGHYRRRSLSIYTRVEDSTKGIFTGMCGGEKRLFAGNDEVVRCSL